MSPTGSRQAVPESRRPRGSWIAPRILDLYEFTPSRRVRSESGIDDAG